MTRIQDLQGEVARQVIRQEQADAVSKQAPPENVGAPKIVDDVHLGQQPIAPELVSSASGIESMDGAQAQEIFAALAAQSSSDESSAVMLGEPIDLGTDLSPRDDSMSGLAQLQSIAAGETDSERQGAMLASTGKLQDGVMLLLNDGAQSYSNEKSKVPRGLVAHMAEQGVFKAKGVTAFAASLQNATTTGNTTFPMDMDVEAFVQAVLRESYLLQTESLKDFAENVKACNDRRKAIRKQIQAASNLQSKLTDGESIPDGFDFITFDDTVWDRKNQDAEKPGDGGNPDSSASVKPYTKDEMTAYVQCLQNELQGSDGDSQLANSDLQNALQQQQQTLSMMSNMSKMLYDTTMSIVRKIGS